MPIVTTTAEVRAAALPSPQTPRDARLTNGPFTIVGSRKTAGRIIGDGRNEATCWTFTLPPVALSTLQAAPGPLIQADVTLVLALRRKVATPVDEWWTDTIRIQSCPTTTADLNTGGADQQAIPLRIPRAVEQQFDPDTLFTVVTTVSLLQQTLVVRVRQADGSFRNEPRTVGYASDEILTTLVANHGRLPLVYEDDAIVTYARLFLAKA